MAIEQGRLIFGQFAMKVDTQPFPGINMVELSRSARRRLDFSFDVNMAWSVYRHGKDKEQSLWWQGRRGGRFKRSASI
jgi:hypothetical protein